MGNKEDVIDIDLSEIRKQRIRINGDDSKILEFNTADLGILGRLQESYEQFRSLAGQYADIVAENSQDLATNIGSIDGKIRELVDYIFNAPVSSVCCSDGTMLDPYNGKYKFEYIVDKLIQLFGDHIRDEYQKMDKRIESKVSGKIANYLK
jgi:hypothetical protein